MILGDKVLTVFNLEFNTIQIPDIKLMTDKDVEDYTQRCLDE